MTSFSQNDYYYNNENDALSYNSRPISSTNYIKNSSYGHTQDPVSLKRVSSGYHHSGTGDNGMNAMYDNYGGVVASGTNGGVGGGLTSASGRSGGGSGSGSGMHYYSNSSMNNDNDIYHHRQLPQQHYPQQQHPQQQQQPYNSYGYQRSSAYYDDSCDNMSDYGGGGGGGGDNRMSGRHSAMSSVAKQLPQIPMKHSSSMVDGISYARGASLPTTPPVAYKRSRMLPQPTANGSSGGGIGGTTGKCLPATPRALPQVYAGSQAPMARSGTGRKLLPTPVSNHHPVSDSYDNLSTSSYDNVTISNAYNTVRPHSSIPPSSYNDDYHPSGYSTPQGMRSTKLGNGDLSFESATPVTTSGRDLYDAPMITSTTTTADDMYYDTRYSNGHQDPPTSGNGCCGVGRKLPKRLPTPNVKTNTGSGKQLPKLPTHNATGKSLPQPPSLISDYSKSINSYSYTSTQPSATATSSSGGTASSLSSNLYPPPARSFATTSGYPSPSPYQQTSALASASTLSSASASASSKSSTTYSTAVTSSVYDDDGNSYLNGQYRHSLKSYPPEITTTSTATVTTAVTVTTSIATTTTTLAGKSMAPPSALTSVSASSSSSAASSASSSTSSFSVTDYLKKFDIKSSLPSAKAVTTPKITASASPTTSGLSTTNTTMSGSGGIGFCSTCGSTVCTCKPPATTTSSAGSLPNGPLSKVPNGPLTYVPGSSQSETYSKPPPTTAVTTTNYSSYISDYLKIYSSSDYNYDGRSTLVETNVGGIASVTAASTTTTTTSTTSYITSYLGGDYLSKSTFDSTTLGKVSTPTSTCEYNGCSDYSSKPYDSIDYFSLATTTTDYSEYLTPSKSTVVNTAMVNGEDVSCFKYLNMDTSTAVTVSSTITEISTTEVKVISSAYDDLYNYSPTPTVTTIASNDDPYSYLDAYKVDLPVYSTDYGSSTESYVLDTYTEPNYSTTMSKTRLETSSNDCYDDYQSSTATPTVAEGTINASNYKSYLYETNSNSGSGSGSSSNASSDHLLAKYDLTTSSSASMSSGSTVVTSKNATSGGYYQPASSKSTPSLNTASTPQKAASAAASKASSMFGSLSQGIKGGLDGVLSGVAAVASDTNKQQPQQQSSAASGIKSSAKSFGFGLASKLIPNLSGAASQQTKTATTKPDATSKSGTAMQKPTITTTPPMTSSYEMSYNTNQGGYLNDNQAYSAANDGYDTSEMDHLLTTSSDISTCGDWNGMVGHSQSIYTTDSLMYDTDYNQGMYDSATTTSGMMLDNGYESAAYTQHSSLDSCQMTVTTAANATNGLAGAKIVDYSDDYKYGYDEYSYSENDYIATGDITDSQNYNNNYDYMDDDATIVSQLLDNAAAKMAAEAAVSTGSQITTTASRTSSFDATTTRGLMDESMKPPVQVMSAMTTASQQQHHQQQQQQPAPVSTASSKLGPSSLLSSLTSVAIGGQQPQGQQQQPATKTTSTGGGGLFGSFLGKAAAAVQSASQVVSTATAMTTAAVKVVPGTPFAGDKNATRNSHHDTEMSNTLVSGAGGAAVVTTTTTTSLDDYENSNLYEDDYYATSTTTTNTATNANANVNANAHTNGKMLPTVPLSSGKKLPAINGKSGLLMKQQPTEIYDEDEEEYIDELEPNYRMDSEQDDYFMDQAAPSTTASLMAVNGYYVSQDGGYDYREDYFNEEDEYKYLEKEQQLKELRKQQQLMKHQKQPPLEYIEESHDDYLDDNYPSEDSANYMDDIHMSKEPPSLQVPVVTTTTTALMQQQHQQQQQQQEPPVTSSINAATTPTSNAGSGLIHHQIKKQDSIIEEDEDEALLTPDDSLQHEDQHQPPKQQQSFGDDPMQVQAKKKTLTRGETEEVTSGQMMRKPEITARQRWNWAYNKIIMQLNVSTKQFLYTPLFPFARKEGFFCAFK